MLEGTTGEAAVVPSCAKNRPTVMLPSDSG